MTNATLAECTREQLVARIEELEAEKRANEGANNPSFRKILDELAIGIFLCDRKGVCHYMNPILSEMMKVPVRASARDILVDRINKEDRQSIEAAWARALSTGKGLRGVCRIELPGGDSLRALGQCHRIKDSKPERWLGSVVILDPKSQGTHVFSDWQPLAEHARDFLIECDQQGNVTFANAVARDFLGSNTNFLEELDEKDEPKVFSGWKKLWDGEPMFKVTCRHFCGNSDGRRADWVISRPPGQAVDQDRAICLGRLEEGPGAVTMMITMNGLTLREAQVLELAVQGLRNVDISEQLDIQESTVKFHLNSIFKKTNTRNRTELTARVAELASPK